MLVGAHESIQGGLARAVARGRADGCRALQIFTKAPQTWKSPTIKDAQAEAFQLARSEGDVGPVMVHDSYLINLCAENTETRTKSWAAFKEEAGRCDQIGAEYLVFHPGSPGSADEQEAVVLIAECLVETLAMTERVQILLENTAGQGKHLGYAFAQLIAIIERAGASERLGVCFDTCHAFAAGYDLRTESSARAVFSEFDDVVGAKRLRAFHLNDSRKPLGSRVDRHARIGKGEIGIALFRYLVNASRFRHLPSVLETPVPNGETYAMEIDLLKSLQVDTPHACR